MIWANQRNNCLQLCIKTISLWKFSELIAVIPLDLSVILTILQAIGLPNIHFREIFKRYSSNILVIFIG